MALTIASELINIISFKIKNSEEAKAIASTKNIISAIDKMKQSLEKGKGSQSFIERQLEKQRAIVRKLDDNLTHARGNVGEINKALNVHLALVDKWEKELRQVTAENQKLSSNIERENTALAKNKNQIDAVVNKYEKWNNMLRRIDSVGRQIQFKIGAPLAALDTLAVKTIMDFQQLAIAFEEAFGTDTGTMTGKMEKLSKDMHLDQRKTMEMMINLKNSGYTGDQAIDVIRKNRILQIATDPKGDVGRYTEAMAEIKRKGYADAGDVRQFGPEVEKRIRSHYGLSAYMSLDEQLGKFGGPGLQRVLENAINQSAASHEGALTKFQGSLPGQFQSMMESFTNFLNKLGESFAGKGLGKLFEMASKLLDFLSKPEIMSILSVVIGIVTIVASSGLITVIAKIALILPTLIPMLATVFRVGTLFLGLSNPLGLLITVLTLLPGVIMLLNGTFGNNGKKRPVDLVDKMLAERNNPINSSHEVNINVNAAPGMTQRELDKVKDAASSGVNDSLKNAAAFYSLFGAKVE